MQGRELKAEAVRAGVTLYKVAATVGVHPNKLSTMLNGHAPLPPADVARIQAAISKLADAPERAAP